MRRLHCLGGGSGSSFWISSGAKSMRIGPVVKTLTDVRICPEDLKKPEFDSHNHPPWS
jgi:hypothetical protein